MKSRKHLREVVVTVEEPGPNRNANAICRAAILLLVSFAFGLAAPSSGYAAVRTVCASGCKYTTIAAAIAAAKAGDTISILDAVHTESNITVDRNLTIQGRGAAKTAVDGAANGTVFTVGSGVTAPFQNLTIRNGLPIVPLAAAAGASGTRGR
jgi:pectin methylesterase-like acyl-CoA thioesterase